MFKAKFSKTMTTANALYFLELISKPQTSVLNELWQNIKHSSKSQGRV